MEKNRIPKVSIIIPIYNTEKYLMECMDSVLNQTLTDIEIICIDDGSDDGSGKIVDSYREKDSRVIVIHKKNTGYGDTVNCGIDEAQGEYVGIIEPDDYIHPDMMRYLYKEASGDKLDMVSADHVRFYGSGKDKVYQRFCVSENKDFYNKIINPSNQTDIFKCNFINPAGIFNKAFLKKNKIRHNTTSGASYQDIGFCFQVLMYSKKIKILDKAFYYYRQDNPNSSIASKAKMNCVISEYKFIYNIIEQNQDEKKFIAAYNRRRYGSYMYTLQRLAPELQLDFLGKICLEFKEFDKNGKLDTTLFSEKWKRDIEEIMKSPNDYYNRIQIKRIRINKAIGLVNDIILYGVGVVGKRIYDEMYDEDKAKVRGFAVSEMNNNDTNYKGVSIRQIMAYESHKSDWTVIVCVTEKYQDEILQILREREFVNTICLESDFIRELLS